MNLLNGIFVCPKRAKGHETNSMRTSQKPGETFCAYVRRRRAQRRAMALHVCLVAQDSTSARLAERFTLAMCGCTCDELLKSQGTQ